MVQARWESSTQTGTCSIVRTVYTPSHLTGVMSNLRCMSSGCRQGPVVQQARNIAS